ncbi:MAG TPA: methionine--tRNA ligase [Candidatus Aphodocola excrementigallinarum]|uniref:Methionine--tRNA ligase n=1 Tax=Candidatus Aphodocola excrementigallinarum TaxID=2840670 RepID=A0A9D1IR38_9FIRM|nr:methionine--tRNA ligase [Candidatus Aphodocola excrementigallinarum]
MDKKKYYITTAIAYTSGKPHIGNTYEIVLADAIARYKRQKGYDVYFQTGTDEHGEKIELKAKEKGITPKEFVDNVATEIKRIWDVMNTSYDKFVRTTDPHHEKIVQKIFDKMYDNGDIYKGEYKGLYCTPCESFWTESQLVDGKCPDCGREVEEKKEEAYFFRLSKYQDKLVDYIENHPEFIQPESRKNEMLNNFIKPGLQDLCVSRTSFDWGVTVDIDPKHVVYVWLDALTNYITNIGYDPEGLSDDFKKWWPADLHVIGKDIVRFHTIYWPCFLWSLGLELPKKVFGHPWLLTNNDKIGKSRGNAIYADDLVDLFGVDAVRYYVLHEIPYANDGNLTYELLIERTNTDLANTLGNLVNRTISMANKYFDGVVTNKNVNESVDDELILMVNNLDKRLEDKMDKLEIGSAIEEIFEVLRRSNKYIDETTPWSLAKESDKKDRLETVLYNLLESIRVCAYHLRPFLTKTSDEIFKQLNIKDEKETFNPNNIYKDMKPEVLFARIDKEKKLKEIEDQVK